MDTEKSLGNIQQPQPEEVNSIAKKYHVYEKHREESFKFWPFDEKKPCNIKKVNTLKCLK